MSAAEEKANELVRSVANVFHPSFAKVDKDHYRKAYGHWSDLIKSGVLPRDVKTPQVAMALAEAGAVRGWSAFQSLELLCMIQGTVAMRAKGMWTQILGFVREHSAEGMRARPVERSSKRAAIDVIRPDVFGTEPVTWEFTQEMAKQANLWGKAGPWSQYPEAMLWARVVGIVGRDAFADVIHGLYTEEEVRDMAPIVQGTVTQIVTSGNVTTLDDLATTPEAEERDDEAEAEADDEGPSEEDEDEPEDYSGEDDAPR